MKETTKMSRAVGQLEKIYNALNADKFGGALPLPIITVQSKPGTFGHCSIAKVWRRKEDSTYELNIAAEVLSYPIEETLDTMLHEMVHLYCRENGIQEVSRGGKYHNGRFKAEAEKVGLTCFKTEKYGWNTRPNDELVAYALEKGWNEIRISRGGSIGFSTGPMGGPQHSEAEMVGAPGGKRPSSTRKLVCPKCGMSVRATRKVNILCGDCMETMTEV